MEDLIQMPYNKHLRFASFNVSNMYSNIPMGKIPPITTLLCMQNNINKKFSRELIKLAWTILKQSYFQFRDDIYTQTEGLAMGAPSSSLFSEIYLQYLEHTTIFDILLQQLTRYFKYVDDILLVYNTQTTNIHNVLDQFNQVHPKLKFTLEEEADHHIHFLDITISRNNNNIQFRIFCKPTTADTIIPYELCHPDKHKISAVQFLRNRNITYLNTPDSKQHKTTVINHILQANNYKTSFGNKQKPSATKPKIDTQNKRWATFTYMGREVTSITNIFKHTNLQIAFTTKNNIGKLLSAQAYDRNTDIYMNEVEYMD
jgi:hypothetical protein